LGEAEKVIVLWGVRKGLAAPRERGGWVKGALKMFFGLTIKKDKGIEINDLVRLEKVNRGCCIKG